MRKTYNGNEISEYGQERGYVDYACLASCFNHVLCNSIVEKFPFLMENLISGCPYRYYNNETGNEITEEEYNEMPDTSCVSEEFLEVYQYYIVSHNALYLLEEAGEIVYYCEDLDVYVWAVTHYGTSWDYVLTSIKIDW